MPIVRRKYRKCVKLFAVLLFNISNMAETVDNYELSIEAINLAKYIGDSFIPNE